MTDVTGVEPFGTAIACVVGCRRDCAIVPRRALPTGTSKARGEEPAFLLPPSLTAARSAVVLADKYQGHLGPARNSAAESTPVTSWRPIERPPQENSNGTRLLRGE
jgi:hypothetical protein